MKRVLAATLLCALLFTAVALFAADTTPTTYSHVSRNRMLGDTLVRAQRDGSRALVQLTSATDPKQMNIKNYYDFAAHRVYTVDLNSNLCSTIAYTSPYPPPLNDVVPMADQMRKQIAESKAQGKPGEAVAGLATKVYDVKGDGVTVKIWVDEKYGIPLKQIFTPAGQKPVTAVEVSEISFTAPPASTFTFPTGCKKLEGTTDANGGHAVMQ